MVHDRVLTLAEASVFSLTFVTLLLPFLVLPFVAFFFFFFFVAVVFFFFFFFFPFLLVPLFLFVVVYLDKFVYTACRISTCTNGPSYLSEM